MSAQIITSPGGERLIVLPESEYEALRSAAEDASDVAAVHAFERRMASGEEELIPHDVVTQLLSGENPMRVWRKHRGLSARQLAAAAGLSAAYVSEIETGKKEGSLSATKRIAEALRVDMDDLV